MDEEHLERQISEISKCYIWPNIGFSFYDKIINFHKKTKGKVNILIKLAKMLTLKEGRILMRTFVISWFSYCWLLSILSNRRGNHRAKHIHGRELKAIHRDCDHGDLMLLSENTFYIW